MAVQAHIPPPPTRETRSVPETAAILGISPRSAWNAIRRDEIKAVRIGSRVLVPITEIDRLLQRTAPGEGGHDVR